MTTATTTKPFSQETADNLAFARDCYGRRYNDTETVRGLVVTATGYGVVLAGPSGSRTISLEEFSS